jgi:low affinity Fe/Cu permease
MQEKFRKFARRISDRTGSPWAFVLAVAVVVAWLAAGPWFHYSDTWQLVINTSTTIVTFLMVFLIQNTQNRDSMVMQLKLDELLRAVEAARTGLVALEDVSDETLSQLKKQFSEMSERSDVELPIIEATSVPAVPASVTLAASPAATTFAVGK